PYFEFQVERPAVALPGQPSVPFPEVLRRAGVKEGEVLVQFIVDTAGYMQPGSFKLLQSTHPLFTSAVSTALKTMRFQPAVIKAHSVEQLMQQTFTFSLPP